MSITFSQAKLKGEERRAILQAIETQMQQVIIEGVTQMLQEFLEQEVTIKLGRPKRSPRRMSSQARPIDWQCVHCGCTDANQFTRDGHYRRSLETGWGHLDTLRVPMLECQRCEHDVVAQFAILEKYQRFWLDAQHRAIFGSGLSRSLRQLSQEWAATLGTSVGLRTINERINQLEAKLAQVHHEPITQVPAVVQFDGIWLEPGRPSKTVSMRIAASASVSGKVANASWRWWPWEPSTRPSPRSAESHAAYPCTSRRGSADGRRCRAGDLGSGCTRCR